MSAGGETLTGPSSNGVRAASVTAPVLAFDLDLDMAVAVIASGSMVLGVSHTSNVAVASVLPLAVSAVIGETLSSTPAGSSVLYSCCISAVESWNSSLSMSSNRGRCPVTRKRTSEVPQTIVRYHTIQTGGRAYLQVRAASCYLDHHLAVSWRMSCWWRRYATRLEESVDLQISKVRAKMAGNWRLGEGGLSYPPTLGSFYLQGNDARLHAHTTDCSSQGQGHVYRCDFYTDGWWVDAYGCHGSVRHLHRQHAICHGELGAVYHDERPCKVYRWSSVRCWITWEDNSPLGAASSLCTIDESLVCGGNITEH